MKSSRGFTLLELIVGVSIIALSGLGIVAISNSVAKNSVDVGVKSSVTNSGFQLRSIIENPEAWGNTLQHNASMACLKSKADCHGAAEVAQPFIVYDSKNQLYYDPTVQTNGFAQDGQPCANFSDTSRTCPYRFEVSWRAICQVGSVCKAPMVSIKADLKISSAIKAASVQASFEVLRGFSMNTLRRSCAAMGGTYNTSTRICDRGGARLSCPSGQVLAGLNADGTLICRALFTGLCSGVTVVSGFDSSTGAPVCTSTQTQVPLAFPNVPSGPSCGYFGKAEGAVWLAAAGKFYMKELCPNGSTGELLRGYKRDAEMTCLKGFVSPTGRTHDVVDTVTIGSCEQSLACSDHHLLGELYTNSASSIESFSCFGSDVVKRDINYRIDEQLLCTLQGDQPTGHLVKTELSRGTCPAQSMDLVRNFTIEGGGQKARGKILFVVDNSNSMQSAISNLSDGVATFLSDLKTADIDVKVINTSGVTKTTTNFPTSTAIVTDVNGAVVNESLMPLGSLITRTYRFQMAATHLYSLSSGATPEQLTTFRNRVKTAISYGAGTSLANATNGDTTEVGLCSALTALYDEGPNQFFKRGDIGGIVFLTDDNDYSTWLATNSASCRNIQKDVYRRDAVAQTVYYDKKYYVYSYAYTSLSFGRRYSNNRRPNIHRKRFGGNRPLRQDLVQSQKTDAIRTTYAAQGKTLTSCSITTASDRRSVTYDTVAQNFCVGPFVYGAIPYANILAYYNATGGAAKNYVAGDCTRGTTGGLTSTSVAASSSRGFENFESGGPASIYNSTIQAAIFNRAKNLFGETGFYISNIVNNGTCHLTAGQLVSQKYLDVPNLFALSGHGVSFPVCQSDYSGALKPMADGLLNSIDNSVVFNQAANETLRGIQVVRDGVTIVLKSNQYAKVGARIDFIGFQLLRNDVVNIQVTSTLSE